jgi:prepilin signal peptidase PulO-like enzyme (type II secretory pathway)
MIDFMEQIFVSVGLVLFGLIIGSFNGAMVWRLRARQLEEDKAAGERVSKKEYDRLKKLLQPSLAEDRSMCLHCHHQLAWYDLLPLVSWVSLRGKCRYCHHKIGRMEPLIELGTAAFFLVSYLAWPFDLTNGMILANFVLWLVIGNGLIILFAYDARWFLLPNRIVFPLIGLAAVSAVLHIIQAEPVGPAIISLVGSCLILSGLYYFLYKVSNGQWIGFGDIKLGLVLALVLADWPLAFLTLFLANVIGCLVVLPGLLTKKLKRTSHVPFGPMLIAAYFIVGLFGPAIITWYFSTFSL